MRFAHMADCHIGAWNDPKMRQLSHHTFEQAIELCINEKLDFILIAGDLFNTALPSIDSLKMAVENLKKLKDHGIRTYVIPGSHDFSPSGKTILDVLEKAELIVNVFRIEEGSLRIFLDEKTNTEIAGILGRRGGLEKELYKNLSVAKDKTRFRIFMFHSAIKELLPKNMNLPDSMEIAMLPKGFDYYAGGHIHIISQQIMLTSMISYPGPLFPNNFPELEELKCGGLYIVEKTPAGISAEHRKIMLHDVFAISHDCANKTPEEINSELIALAEKSDVSGKIVTIRLFGELRAGKTADIDFRQLIKELNLRGAYFVMRNTTKLLSRDFHEIKVTEESIEKIEDMLIEKNAGQMEVSGWGKEQEKAIIKSLMHQLDKEKEDGETTADFEKRIKEDTAKMI
jgi:exonuclease SbcD